MSNTAASSSPDLGEAASLSDEQCHHLVPVGGVGVSDMVRGGVVAVGSQLQRPGQGGCQKGG